MISKIIILALCLATTLSHESEDQIVQPKRYLYETGMDFQQSFPVTEGTQWILLNKSALKTEGVLKAKNVDVYGRGTNVSSNEGHDNTQFDFTTVKEGNTKIVFGLIKGSQQGSLRGALDVIGTQEVFIDVIEAPVPVGPSEQ